MKTRKNVWIVSGLVFLMLLAAGAKAELGEEVKAMAGEIEGKELPGAVKFLLGNERINIYIQMKSGGEEVLSFVTEGGKVKSLGPGKAEDASLNVYLQELTVEEIEKAENPIAAIRKALEEKKINYKGVGWLNKLKFGVAGLATKILIRLSGEEGKMEIKAKGQEEAKAEDKGEEGKEKGEKEAEKPETAEKLAKEREAKEEEKESGEEKLTGGAVVGEETEKEKKPKSHFVQLVDGGFEVKKITIKTGERVVWENAREGKLNKALVVGTQKCGRIKSKMFDPGEYFEWTFEEAGTCTLVDGIFTTQMMKVIVEKS